MSNSSKLPPIRRVVTGHDRNNVAKVIIDGPATNAKSGASGAAFLLYILPACPAIALALSAPDIFVMNDGDHA